MNSRTILMLKEETLKLYQDKRIAIFGVGGVGGYVLESLVRSGFLNIDIYDFDKVDISNLNRQIISTVNNIGEIKVDTAKQRALSINPDVLINAYNMYVDEETIKQKALAEENVIRHTEGKEIVKVIVIKGKIVNIVVK